MRQITQTKLYRPADHPEGPQHGNCQRAAMASILEIGIDDMPPFEEAASAGRFWRQIHEWLEEQGITYRSFDASAPPEGYSIASGPAPRGVSHAVVALDGKVVWDPHPSRTGLLKIEEYETIRPMTADELKDRDIRCRMAAAKAEKAA